VAGKDRAYLNFTGVFCRKKETGHISSPWFGSLPLGLGEGC